MVKTKIDPRIIRTRKLIMDSFIKLSGQKDFNAITVKDITEEAMINRATFYNHFLDKYDLLEKVVEEKLSLNLGCEQQKSSLPIDQTIKEIFLSLTRFEQSVNGYSSTQEEKETIDAIITLELNNIFSNKLTETDSLLDSDVVDKLASWLTNSVIGMSRDWLQSTRKETPEEYITPLLPYITYGIEKI